MPPAAFQLRRFGLFLPTAAEREDRDLRDPPSGLLVMMVVWVVVLPSCGQIVLHRPSGLSPAPGSGRGFEG